MKRIASLFFAALFILTAVAQQRSPSIRVQDLNQGEKPVRISDLRIDVKVVGSLAVTTVDMTFYNPNNRVLEGELEFPLADGQSISRYALDINGKLREGVVVEKAKGQAVFESIVRRGVDPGLLEKTEGNNFRTRVYPLMEKMTRRVVIAYEQELTPDKGSFRFFLPVKYGDILDNFSLNVTVFSNGQKPTVDKSPWGSFAFDKSGESYIASYTEKNYQANEQIVFSIPVKDDIQLYAEKGKISGQTVFYTQLFPDVTQSAKVLPKKLALYWDASSSMAARNFDMEVELLDKYFKKAGNLTVNLYTFNYKENKPQSFRIDNGNWDKLKAALRNVTYDGATQLGALDFTKVQADEILMFTDGLTNLGKKKPQTGNIPVITVNTSLSADYNMLRYISSATGGIFINLAQQTADEALKLLTTESLRLISTDYNQKEIEEFTTSGSVIDPAKGLSVAGKLKTDKATVTLNFGTGNRVSQSKTITIDSQHTTDYGNMVEKLWAAKRIAELDLLYDQNREEIEVLGRAYNIVTRNTSLIVLENINDYLQHKITPPEELLEEYNKYVEEYQKTRKTGNSYYIEEIIRMFDRRKAWWNTRYPLRPVKPVTSNQPAPRPVPSQPTVIRTASEGQYTITGVVKEASGEAIIGAVVLIKNVQGVGTVTDIDGGFSLKANNNDILQFRFIGFEPREITVTGNQTLEVVLEESKVQLDEVVVTGFGSQRKQTVTGAITTVDVSELQVPTEDLTGMLAGRVKGVITFGGALDISSKSSEQKGEITLKAWEADAPYMETLRTKKDKELYQAYLDVKEENKDTPSFYLDVAALFEERKMKEDAFVVLSNLAEMKLEDYRLLRVLAHRLKQLEYNEYAIGLFTKVLELRPEEPQSYRDLALAYAQNKEYQKAIDMMSKIFEQKWDRRFQEVELFAAEEINNMIEKAKREGKELDLSRIDERLIFNMPVDIRIVLSWDTDNSDMDLWVFDPDGEKCYYKNKLTKLGGMISQDFTGGYGPEEFLIKKAKKGKYTIKADYYGSREQTLVGPTTIYLDIYTHYGTAKETKKTITLRLTKDENEVEIGEIVF